MDQEKVDEVATVSLEKAEFYVSKKNWLRAFPHYLMYFELYPYGRCFHEKEFSDILYHLGVYLEEKGRYRDLFDSYMKALKYFPVNVHIINNFCAHLLRFDEPELALPYLTLAYTIESDYLPLEKNLQTCKLNLIPRWHFCMLNDIKRNDAYRKAIQKAATPRNNAVLDIGAGCGLLSFFALECRNVTSVTAVESSKTLSKIAQTLLPLYGFVKVINEYSTRLTRADVGLSNLLVTEVFDAALFGEHVLETLIHAWENLLEPAAKIIPCAADVFITGIGSKAIGGRHRLCTEIPGLDFENLCVTQTYSEPYETENLKDKLIKYVTETQKAVHVNFSDLNQLKDLYTSRNAIPTVNLKCINAGTIDAFAIWFDLHLNEDITITTNPFKDSVKCWEQAIIYLDHPIKLEMGQEVSIQLSCVGDKLEIKVLNPVITCHSCTKISQEIITFLNDIQIVEAAADLTITENNDNDNCQILDMNPFPLFALFQAKKGFKGHYKGLAKNDADSAFIDLVWRRNISCRKTEFKIYNPLKLSQLIPDRSIDILFAAPISKNGTLCEETFMNYRSYRFQSPDTLIFPTSITLQIEVIDSKYLNTCYMVHQENLLGFPVAQLMNEYSILEQWDVEPQYYNRRTLGSCAGHTFYLQYQHALRNVPYQTVLPFGGRPNGALYWYELRYAENVLINTYKSLHYKGAIFILENPKIYRGNALQLNITQSKGLIKIDSLSRQEYHPYQGLAH